MGEVELGTRTVSASPVPCLRCGSDDTLRLEKARVEANTCYRCRGCGHIFSPGSSELPLGDVASP